ncbi:MAG TPA: aminotransferase class I/II-fold pyridoxal phosphate-dependent enzyme, partial [Candidatus Nanopelagicales bacterium]|nr:aminotransferase class I/II-fold pyridoxal phosphate-dependent enzyme [Candidatus Nanopelagicales bacterium]
PVEIPARAEDGFWASLDAIAEAARGARLLCMNTPLNPVGSMMSPDYARAIGRLVLEENHRRRGSGERPLILLVDQLYWSLSFARPHVTPVHEVREVAPWTVLVDGITKMFAATGLRVGWAVAQPALIAAMSTYLGHIGGAAPTAEQAAAAAVLGDPPSFEASVTPVRQGIWTRLQTLARGVERLRAEGLPIDQIEPEGSMYLAMRLDLFGRAWGGETIRTNEAIRRFALEEAGVSMLPFQAFDHREESGWFRLAVGSASVPAIEEGLSRLGAALRRVCA